MISNKSKWKCNSGWYVHLYSVVYAAQQQGGYHPPFKLRGKLVLLLLLLGFEIFYQKPCRWFDPLFQCVCILKKISLLISSLAAKNHTPSPHKPKSHPPARDWELAHLWALLFIFDPAVSPGLQRKHEGRRGSINPATIALGAQKAQSAISFNL